MAKALFISKNDLVKQTPLSANIDFDKVSHFIQIAQDIHVHQLLGSKLYDRLQADVIGGTLAGDYSTLVYDYIKPTLVQYSFMEYLPFSQYTISNKGVFKHHLRLIYYIIFCNYFTSMINSVNTAPN